MIQSINIPVIGLGAGQNCHGYGIAVQDMLVMDPIKSMRASSAEFTLISGSK